MATGDAANISARLHRWLPPRWFPRAGDGGPFINALLSGFAAAFASLYASIQLAALQIRIATATGGFLELIASDYFGAKLPRTTGELDPAYSARIRREIMRERVTREAIDRVIFDTTGNHPLIIEASRTSDIGCLRQGFALGVSRYGSKGLPFQVFVTAQRQNPNAMPLVAGLRTYLSGFRAPNFAYLSRTIIPPPQPPDTAIIAAIERVRAAGITVWLNLTNAPLPPPVVQTIPRGKLLLNQPPLSGFDEEMGMQ